MSFEFKFLWFGIFTSVDGVSLGFFSSVAGSTFFFLLFFGLSFLAFSFLGFLGGLGTTGLTLPGNETVKNEQWNASDKKYANLYNSTIKAILPIGYQF